MATGFCKLYQHSIPVVIFLVSLQAPYASSSASHTASQFLSDKKMRQGWR